jgi:amino acid adenylation domain-containing protein
MSRRGATKTLELSPELTRGLAELGRAHGASLYVSLLTAFHVLLARHSGQNDIIVGSPVAGRTRAGMAGLVGYFVNPLPIRARLARGMAFVECLAQVRHTVVSGLEHQEFPFPLMVERSELARDPRRSPIFQVMFVFQKAQRLAGEGLTPFALRGDGPRMELAGIPVESLALDLGVAQYDLTMMAAEADGRVVASLEYSTDLFDGATIERMLERFQALLEGVVARPEVAWDALPVMADTEERCILREWNATDARDNDHTCIHRLIEKRAALSPGAVAVAVEATTLTYGEMNARANELARRLRALGVGPDARVGLCVERSAEMVIGILAILKAGGAYVPLDPKYPADRIAFLIEDSRIRILLAQEALLHHLPAHGATVVGIAADSAPPSADGAENLEDVAEPRNLAYVIYTSGSTGTPKGVLVTHENLVHSTLARGAAYQQTVGRFLLLSSFAFDSSIAGLFWTLCDGGTLVLPPQSALDDPHQLASLIDGRRVSHMLCVPSLYNVLLGEAQMSKLQGLRTVIVAGEACPRDLVARHYSILCDASLYNEYGPTEATVWCSVAKCEPGDAAAMVPIGRPIANARLYVLDPLRRPVPVGVAGELYVGGAGVTRGYLDRPSLTAERFIPDPFGQSPGSRLYRTGDLARWRPDGQIDFLGRIDQQVKIRGHRIELSEVELALMSNPAVRDAIVVVNEETTGEARLVGYVVPAPGMTPSPSELRAWLRTSLPEYMVPSLIVSLAALPLSPNGKVDRQALPAPDRELSSVAAYVAPRTRAEELLAAISASALGRERVGVDDNLFDLGIDSIRGILIASRARQTGLRLTPAQLFEHPTIAALANIAEAATPTEEVDGTDLSGHAARARAEDEAVEDAYPLSPTQQGMLFHSLAEPSSGVYVQQFTCVLRGALDAPRFAQALSHIIQRHAVLRTAIQTVEWDRPVQLVYRAVELPLEEHDWRQFGATEQCRRLGEFLHADRKRGFVPSWAPLLRVALIRLGQAAYQLVWSNHHLLMDGWCIPLLFKEVILAYEAFGRGVEPGLSVGRPYRDYIAWLQRAQSEEAAAYWRGTLRGFAKPTPLGTDRVGLRDPIALGPTEECELQLAKPLTDSLQRFARDQRLTLSTLVQAAWGLLLSRYSGKRDIVFGVTVSGRPPELAGVESTVGLFINTLPLRLAISPEARVLPWLADLQARQTEMRKYETTPLVDVHGFSDVPRGLPLFESILVFENFPTDDDAWQDAAAIHLDDVHILERTNYPLTLTAIPGNRLTIRVAYDRWRFEEATIERLLGHLQTVLQSMAEAPQQRLRDVSLMTDEEQSQLSAWNDTATFRADAWGSDEDRIRAELERMSDPEVEALLGQYGSGDEAICHE